MSLDELVGIFTHVGREVEGIGVSNSYSLAERVVAVIEEARPLLRKVRYVHFVVIVISVLNNLYLFLSLLLYQFITG